MVARIKYIVIFALVISVLYFLEKAIDYSNSTSDKEIIKDTIENRSTFTLDLLPSSTTGSIVTHHFYTLSYNEVHEQAEWVAYELLKEHLKDHDYERSYFNIDPAVGSGSADWKNYKNSGYDRGHLCPAGDRRFSSQAYEETFLTSNISPQNRNFNSGVWNFLEQKVRDWARKYDGVFVITGGILKPGLPTIGYEDVSVPNEFYKIVFDKMNDGRGFKMIAFLIPNKPVDNSFYAYAVKVDYIEKLTGIDFFQQLPDSIENILEAKVDLKSWGKTSD